MPLLTPEECIAQFELPVAPCYQSRPDPEHAEPLAGKALRLLYPPPLDPGLGDRPTFPLTAGQRGHIVGLRTVSPETHARPR
jgi:hypothetical protein